MATFGKLDGKEHLIDWKTKTSRYAEEPDGLLTLDPQLICYSWITGIPDVAMVVFVRKQQPEIQYLKASISEEQRCEFGRLVETTISQVESGQFPGHLVFLSTLRSLGGGILVGLALTLVMNAILARWVQGNSRDPIILLAGTLLLSFVAGAACLVPARRASKVDPMTALRFE